MADSKLPRHTHGLRRDTNILAPQARSARGDDTVPPDIEHYLHKVRSTVGEYSDGVQRAVLLIKMTDEQLPIEHEALTVRSPHPLILTTFDCWYWGVLKGFPFSGFCVQNVL